MAIIGTFKKTGDGYAGTIRTLALNVDVVTIHPFDSKGDDGPDFKVMVGRIEIGAAWMRTGKKSGRQFLSLKLDDPSLNAPIFANLIDREDNNAELIWTRG